MDKRENLEPFDDEFKDERKYYSDNCVKSDINKNSSTSDESGNGNSFESSVSSEDESGSASEDETDGALSDSEISSNKEDDEYMSSEEDDDNWNMKNEKDEILEGKEVEEIKEIGNKYFKEADYYNATYYYNKAIKKCKDKNTKSVLYSNRAACNILLKKWDAVIKDCTKSINCNENFVKSYIRRSKAYEQLEKYNDASNDLNKAIALDPSLKAIHEKTQKKLTILAEQQLNKEKEEMLGKLKDFGNMLLGKVGLSLDNFEVQKNPNNDGSFNIQFKQNK